MAKFFKKFAVLGFFGLLLTGCVTLHYVYSDYEKKDGEPKLEKDNGVTMNILLLRVEDDGMLELRYRFFNNSSQAVDISIADEIAVENLDSGIVYRPFEGVWGGRNKTFSLPEKKEWLGNFFIHVKAKSKEEFPQRYKIIWGKNNLILHSTGVKERNEKHEIDMRINIR